MQKFQGLLLTFWLEAPVLLREVILLTYLYVGYPEHIIHAVIALCVKPHLSFSSGEKKSQCKTVPKPVSVAQKSHIICKSRGGAANT